jgi:hypothetical protein
MDSLRCSGSVQYSEWRCRRGTAGTSSEPRDLKPAAGARRCGEVASVGRQPRLSAKQKARVGWHLPQAMSERGSHLASVRYSHRKEGHVISSSIVTQRRGGSAELLRRLADAPAVWWVRRQPRGRYGRSGGSSGGWGGGEGRQSTAERVHERYLVHFLGQQHTQQCHVHLRQERRGRGGGERAAQRVERERAEAQRHPASS